MDLGLKGKGAIVTGSSKGIGRAIALGLAAEGANVAICARKDGPLQKTAEEIRAHGVTVFAETCDVSDADALSAWLDKAKEALGSVSILVNNPSGFGIGDDESSWAAGFNVDIMATVRCTWKVVPWLEEAGDGAIIDISSVSGVEASSTPAYGAVKAALISHSKSMALNLARKGIRVNCIAPGSIEFPGGVWDRVKNANRKMYDGVLASIPFGRMGKPEEVANIVVFLCSERASWISGALVPVDAVQHRGIL